MCVLLLTCLLCKVYIFEKEKKGNIDTREREIERKYRGTLLNSKSPVSISIGKIRSFRQSKSISFSRSVPLKFLKRSDDYYYTFTIRIAVPMRLGLKETLRAQLN